MVYQYSNPYSERCVFYIKKRNILVLICTGILFLTDCTNLKTELPQDDAGIKVFNSKKELREHIYEEIGGTDVISDFVAYPDYCKIDNAELLTLSYAYKDSDKKYHFALCTSPGNNDMNFTFESPFDIGHDIHHETIFKQSTLKFHFLNNVFFLYAWSSPLDSMQGAMKYNSKEDIVNANYNTIYKDDTYYGFYDEATYGKAIFKISRNGGYEGYAVYIDDYTTMTTYQFNYVEKDFAYDNNRALDIANSIQIYNISLKKSGDEKQESY